MLLCLILPMLACNMPGQVQPTPGLFSNTRTPINTITLGPTLTPIPPSQTPPPPTPTPGPSPTYAPGFKESFDLPLDNWQDLYVLTTRAPGGRISTAIRRSNGVLTYTLADVETYLYQFYKLPQPLDQYIEMEVRIDGQKENQAALVCRANEDRSAWYEARLSGTGAYQIFRYDLSRKDQDLNPFVLLQEGQATESAFRAGDFNLARLTCQGNRIVLTVNNQQNFEVENDQLRGGWMGYAVFAFSNPDAVIQFDEINAGIP